MWLLERIVGHEQKAYIPGRFIGEVTRTTYDFFQHDKQNNLPGMTLLLDFQKAFDSVSFRFLELTLEVFGFGPNYRKWISILLKGFNSCTVGNGNISERFRIKRGCRQGDPISGYLFILCIEILSLALKNSRAKPYKTIKGMPMI